MLKLTLTQGPSKIVGHFLPGELAYHAERGEILLRVETNTHSPQAFRRIFRKTKEGWKPCYGGLQRFGFHKEFVKVLIE